MVTAKIFKRKNEAGQTETENENQLRTHQIWYKKNKRMRKMESQTSS
jgi:hypothetical protein